LNQSKIKPSLANFAALPEKPFAREFFRNLFQSYRIRPGTDALQPLCPAMPGQNPRGQDDNSILGMIMGRVAAPSS
jgi:hypothetical protein